MGLYCILMKPGAVEKIPETMASLGCPVIRIEQRENGTYYFYEDPGNAREYAFWTHEKDGETFWMSGVSTSAMKMAAGFSSAGLFSEERAV